MLTFSKKLLDLPKVINKIKQTKQILSTFTNLTVMVQYENDLYKHSKMAHSY